MTEGRLIYLDNAATTFPKPECVYQAANDFYRRFGGNAGRGANPLARKGAELIAETRALLAQWLGAITPEQVIFSPSATMALNQAILGAQLRSGDAVYFTPFEHNSVLRPLEHLRSTSDIALHEIPFERHTFACQLDVLEAAFRSEPPAMLCMTQASNVCGLMPPIVEIARRAKAANRDAIVVVDGAQTAGVYPLPLSNELVDAYVFSGHKSLYGPYGIAGLVLASKWRPAPLLFGGTGTASESAEMPRELPYAYEAGSHNVWAIAGLKAAIEWLQATGREELMKHSMALGHHLRDELDEVPGMRVHSPSGAEAWSGILSLSVVGTRPQAIEAVLAAKGIAVRAGLHCAPRTHNWLGTAIDGGTVRISVGAFNRYLDISHLLETIRHLAF